MYFGLLQQGTDPMKKKAGQGGMEIQDGPTQKAWWGWGMGLILRMALELKLEHNQNWKEILA